MVTLLAQAECVVIVTDHLAFDWVRTMTKTRG
jgi:hypothetical protein